VNRHLALKLGDVCEIVSGATPKTTVEEYWDGDIRWVTPADLSGLDGAYLDDTPRKITSAGLASCSAQVLPANSVLLSSRAPIGHVAINTVPMATNQGFKSLVPKVDLADAKFLYHWLKYNKAQIQALGNGATFKEVSKAIVSEISIDLPPLDEQRRIAATLDKADALRQKRKRAIALLDSLAQSIFLEMFGDPLKDYRNDPKWTCEALDANINYIDYRGKTPPKAEMGVRLITAKNVKMGYINPEPMEFIEADAYDDWMTRGFPRKGDVLFTTEAPLGNVAILDSAEKLVVGQRLLTMRPDRSKITVEYLAYYLRSAAFAQKMLENSSGSTVRGIKSSLLKKIEICYPAIERQERFSSALTTVTKMQKQSTFIGTATSALFASLQHRAFSGQL